MSKLTRQRLGDIASHCREITTANAGKNPDVHKDDCNKIVELYDHLDHLASPDAIRSMAMEILHLRRLMGVRVWKVDPARLNDLLSAKPQGMSAQEWFNQQYLTEVKE